MSQHRRSHHTYTFTPQPPPTPPLQPNRQQEDSHDSSRTRTSQLPPGQQHKISSSVEKKDKKDKKHHERSHHDKSARNDDFKPDKKAYQEHKPTASALINSSPIFTIPSSSQATSSSRSNPTARSQADVTSLFLNHSSYPIQSIPPSLLPTSQSQSTPFINPVHQHVIHASTTSNTPFPTRNQSQQQQQQQQQQFSTSINHNTTMGSQVPLTPMTPNNFIPQQFNMNFPNHNTPNPNDFSSPNPSQHPQQQQQQQSDYLQQQLQQHAMQSRAIDENFVSVDEYRQLLSAYSHLQKENSYLRQDHEVLSGHYNNVISDYQQLHEDCQEIEQQVQTAAETISELESKISTQTTAFKHRDMRLLDVIIQLEMYLQNSIARSYQLESIMIQNGLSPDHFNVTNPMPKLLLMDNSLSKQVLTLLTTWVEHAIIKPSQGSVGLNYLATLRPPTSPSLSNLGSKFTLSYHQQLLTSDSPQHSLALLLTDAGLDNSSSTDFTSDPFSLNTYNNNNPINFHGLTTPIPDPDIRSIGHNAFHPAIPTEKMILFENLVFQQQIAFKTLSQLLLDRKNAIDGIYPTHSQKLQRQQHRQQTQLPQHQQQPQQNIQQYRQYPQQHISDISTASLNYSTTPYQTSQLAQHQQPLPQHPQYQQQGPFYSDQQQPLSSFQIFPQQQQQPVQSQLPQQTIQPSQQQSLQSQQPPPQRPSESSLGHLLPALHQILTNLQQTSQGGTSLPQPYSNSPNSQLQNIIPNQKGSNYTQVQLEQLLAHYGLALSQQQPNQSINLDNNNNNNNNSNHNNVKDTNTINNNTHNNSIVDQGRQSPSLHRQSSSSSSTPSINGSSAHNDFNISSSSPEIRNNVPTNNHSDNSHHLQSKKQHSIPPSQQQQPQPTQQQKRQPVALKSPPPSHSSLTSRIPFDENDSGNDNPHVDLDYGRSTKILGRSVPIERGPLGLLSDINPSPVSTGHVTLDMPNLGLYNSIQRPNSLIGSEFGDKKHDVKSIGSNDNLLGLNRLPTHNSQTSEGSTSSLPTTNSTSTSSQLHQPYKSQQQPQFQTSQSISPTNSKTGFGSDSSRISISFDSSKHRQRPSIMSSSCPDPNCLGICPFCSQGKNTGDINKAVGTLTSPAPQTSRLSTTSSSLNGRSSMKVEQGLVGVSSSGRTSIHNINVQQDLFNERRSTMMRSSGSILIAGRDKPTFDKGSPMIVPKKLVLPSSSTSSSSSATNVTPFNSASNGDDKFKNDIIKYDLITDLDPPNPTSDTSLLYSSNNISSTNTSPNRVSTPPQNRNQLNNHTPSVSNNNALPVDNNQNYYPSSQQQQSTPSPSVQQNKPKNPTLSNLLNARSGSSYNNSTSSPSPH